MPHLYINYMSKDLRSESGLYEFLSRSDKPEGIIFNETTSVNFVIEYKRQSRYNTGICVVFETYNG